MAWKLYVAKEVVQEKDVENLDGAEREDFGRDQEFSAHGRAISPSIRCLSHTTIGSRETASHLLSCSEPLAKRRWFSTLHCCSKGWKGVRGVSWRNNLLSSPPLTVVHIPRTRSFQKIASFELNQLRHFSPSSNQRFQEAKSLPSYHERDVVVR